MKQYLELMKYILEEGISKSDRTGVGTLSIFGYQMRFNLQDGFPLITTKKCHFRSIIYELLWFLKGDTNVQYLQENKVYIWDKWANKNGDLGLIYGKQWRNWKTYNNKTVDQINNIILQLKNNPNSRRIIVSSWNVADLEAMALPPCHILFQFYVANNKLSCQVYQRSCDVFLGLPFNIASYALLMHMVAQQCNLSIGDLVWSTGDTHLYKNHLKQSYLQLTRIPYKLPNLKIKSQPKSIFDYQFNDFTLEGYNTYPKIIAPVAI